MDAVVSGTLRRPNWCILPLEVQESFPASEAKMDWGYDLVEKAEAGPTYSRGSEKPKWHDPTARKVVHR